MTFGRVFLPSSSSYPVQLMTFGRVFLSQTPVGGVSFCLLPRVFLPLSRAPADAPKHLLGHQRACYYVRVRTPSHPATSPVLRVGMAMVLVAAGLVADTAAAPPGAPPRATLQVVWTDIAPTIDGRLDDSAWQDAPIGDGFAERTPRLYAKPPHDTRFQALVDAEALYIAIACDDESASAVVARTTVRDSTVIFRDDAISLKLDPQNDRRTTYGFVVNPLGARLDYQSLNEGGFRFEVDFQWESRAQIHAGGWTAEVRIPWSSLGIDPATAPASIGINLSRDHSRRSATYDWVVMPPPYSPVSASLYGRLIGLDVLPERVTASHGGGTRIRSWHLTPYVLGGFRKVSSGDLDAEFDAGLDASLDIGVVRATLTLNTDFAQVDLDDRVVNLDRFSLNLPEKRGFFLTDLDLFSFGEDGETQILQTRRIGLSGGEAVPILNGLKLTARSGDISASVLHVVTRPRGDLPWTQHLAARGQLDLGGGSNVGVMVTDRRSLEDAGDHNVVAGLDGAYRGPVETPLILKGYLAWGITGEDAAQSPPAVGGSGSEDGGMAGASAEWRGRLVRPEIGWRYVDDNFRSDLGFIRRAGVHVINGALEVEPRFDDDALETLGIKVSADLVANPEFSNILDWEVGGDVDLSWDNGWSLGVDGSVNTSTVETPFNLGRTPIEAGAYDGWATSLGVSTPSTWSVSGNVDARARNLFGSLLTGASAGLSLRPGTLVRVAITGQFDHVSFDDERPGFDVVVVNGRVSLGFSPALSVAVFGGFDVLADSFETQSRLRWTFRGGSDLFVVYQVDVDTAAGNVAFQSLLMKATWRIP
jgi:hypothetical protein